MPESRGVAPEMALRLAFIADILHGVELDEDSVALADPEQAGSIMSALDYALRGDPGCVEPDEWQQQREQALAKHADYIGVPDA